MNNIAKPVTIVVADDDPDDRLLIKEALEEELGVATHVGNDVTLAALAASGDG